MSRAAVAKYLGGLFPEVGGWCSPHLWHLIQPIADHQTNLGICNPIAEIGVYQGKFFIGLMATKEAKAGNLAVDVFDLQHLNLDGAGEGNLDIFQSNIARSGFELSAVEIVRADSMALTRGEIEAIRTRTGGFAFFSVDGCHLPEHTCNDISIAIELTIPEGIIFVDDYTNPDWPGVQEAVSKMYFTGSPRFVPLVCGHNKLFLAHISYHSTYLDLIRKKLSASKIHFKPVKRFGYDTLTVHLDHTSSKFFID
jgi:hypothetical protein